MSHEVIATRRERCRASAHRRAWPATVVTAVVAMSACSTSDSGPVQPVQAGTIELSVQTAGFVKDVSYELLVNGESQGTVSADDQIVLSELEPATYELSLGDVADNCEVDGITVNLGSDETADAAFEVVCYIEAGTEYTIRFNRARPDLNDGSITECPFGLCPTEEGWDLYIQFTSGSSIVRANGTTAVEIAHLSGVTLDTMTEADVESATFTTDPVDDAFDSDRVILIRTDTGDVYALGNPVESTLAQTLTFDAVMVAAAS